MTRKILKIILSPILNYRGSKEFVYITFDDGPHPGKTEKCLDALLKYNIKATFFMLGNEMEKNKELVLRIVREGHQIGYHSFDHRRLSELSVKEILKEIKNMRNMKWVKAGGLNLYRPPYGELTLTSLILFLINKIKIVMWSLDSRDSFVSGGELKNNLDPGKINMGDIILFHDDTDITINMLPDILKVLSETNIKFGVIK